MLEVVQIFAETFGGDEAGRVVAGVVDALAGREAFEGGLCAVVVALEVLQQLLVDAVEAGEMRVMATAEGVAGEGLDVWSAIVAVWKWWNG